MHPIAQLHATVPVDVLETLTSKGLVRRAQKDVERGEAGKFTEDAGTVGLTVGAFQVTLTSEGPAKAVCTCPAAGVCQHILAACLHLRALAEANPSDASTAASSNAAPSQPASPEPHSTPSTPPASLTSAGETVRSEWLALSDAELQAWGGLPALRLAQQQMEEHPATIEAGRTLQVRFPSVNVELHALPGAGLDGVILSGVSERKKSIVIMAAVLAVWKQAGREWQAPGGKGDAGAESRPAMPLPEVLRSVKVLLEELLSTGLARLSAAAVQRLDTLTLSALGADAPRLSHSLKRLATQASDWLHRRPHADMAALFREAAFAYALSEGMPGKPVLRGVARTVYHEVGALDLLGISAWPWRTGSGYEGFTALFWDTANREWSTWTEARPQAFMNGFSAQSRYTGTGPWNGADSPARLMGNRLRLMKARRNRLGRLSSSAQCQALVTGAFRPDEFTARLVTDWRNLATLATEAAPAGLGERDPRRAFVLVEPAAWLPLPFDRVEETLRWVLLDGDRRPLHLHLPFEEMTRATIKNLETFAATAGGDSQSGVLHGARLVGRVYQVTGELHISPLTLLTADGRCEVLAFPAGATAGAGAKSASPNLPTPAGPAPESAASTPQTADEDADDEEELEDPDDTPASSLQGPLAETLHGATSALEWLAESGVSGIHSRLEESLQGAARQAEGLHLGALARALHSLQMKPQAAMVLRARWMVQVYGDLAGR